MTVYKLYPLYMGMIFLLFTILIEEVKTWKSESTDFFSKLSYGMIHITKMNLSNDNIY